jgi:hypothetical protein
MNVRMSYRLAQGKADWRGLRPLELAEEFYDRPNKNSLFQVQEAFQRTSATTPPGLSGAVSELYEADYFR